ncbi:hypothetical protein PIB30_043515 [Stylosanthes scabra]|uniref:RRM domain-containing protein n=1 Tax=Stylosanthes scabra TaxID=79078 RepID=A0ABU6TFV9_9FABA|nr:hypothetical protein [Stylosanthes scabra]
MRGGGGVRGRWRIERGKHGEASGYAGRSYKGESGGGCEQGVTKRELYKFFGKNGLIVDIFVSRKSRRNKQGTYAFVRFKEWKDALRARENTNGVLWQGNKLTVSSAKNRKGEVSQKHVLRRTQWDSTISKLRRRVVQKWIPVTMNTNNGKQDMNHKEGGTAGELRRKEIKAVWAEDQRLLLQRSLFGVCVKPIKFRKVMNALLDSWKGPGDIEVRDVGPYRCLVTFSDPEVCDLAMESELLQYVFDAVRHHWNTFWCLSRRVWIEIIDMPISLWCPENFENVAKEWGKVLKLDDRTEEPKSYTVGRILIDSFQWDHINEWVSIKIEDQMFEVHVREVRPEMYSMEAHPNRDPEESESVSMVSDDADGGNASSPVEDQEPQLPTHGEPIHDANDGQLHGSEAILNAKRRSGVGVNVDYDPVAKSILSCTTYAFKSGDESLFGSGNRTPISEAGPYAIRGPIRYRLDHNSSSSSCPYPPGFGPCSDGIHIHKTARALDSVEIVRDTPFSAMAGEGETSENVDELRIASPNGPPHKDNNLCAELSCIKETVPIVVACGEGRAAEKGSLVGDETVASVGAEGTGTESDESLYLINKDVGFLAWLEVEVAGLFGDDTEQIGVAAGGIGEERAIPTNS